MTDDTQTRSLLQEGLVVGFLGAAVVALWFLLVDTVTGVPLQTPAAMGSAIFFGARTPDAVEINAATVFLYSLFHGGMFFVLGTGSAALLRGADRMPGMLALVVLVFFILQVLFVGGVAIMAEFILGYLAWWAVLGGNVLSSVVMVTQLLRYHPATADRLRHPELALPRS